MFETFDVHAMYVAIQAASTLGTMMISCDGVSHTVPIYDGYALHHAILRSTCRFIEQEFSFTAAAEKEIVRDIGSDYDTEPKSNAEETYVFPDRNIITVGAERFHCVAVLLQPDSHLYRRADRGIIGDVSEKQFHCWRQTPIVIHSFTNKVLTQFDLLVCCKETRVV